METVQEVMDALEKKGSEQTRKTYARHGMKCNMFGVKIADLKVIAKTIKGDQQLAYDLYETGNYDAMYLAGIVADGSRMTKTRLQSWAKAADCGMLSDYAVAGVAAESPHARDMAIKWIKSRSPRIASCGWCTYIGLLSTRDDSELNVDEIADLLGHVVDGIADAPNGVRYSMNNFVIAAGAYVKPLLEKAKLAAKKIGKVSVDMGQTSCKVPIALDSIQKIETMGRIGKKRKSPKC